MSSQTPSKLIEEYLHRVKLYLPVYGSSDILREIRTHIIESAEEISQGQLTASAVTQAIERLGEPSIVANEYAGQSAYDIFSPVYFQPWLRLVIVFIAIVLSFSITFTLIDLPTSGIPAVMETLIYTVPATIVFAFLQAAIIIYFVSKITEKDQSSSGKQHMLEGFFGIGTEALKPKSRTDAIGELLSGVTFAIILSMQWTQQYFTISFREVLLFLCLALLFDALVGGLYLLWGENNISLMAEILLGSIWIIAGLQFLRTGFPFDLLSVGLQIADVELLTGLNIAWGIVAWIIVFSSTWKILSATIKIFYYLKENKGLFWRGELL
ncbi:MAG: HAAS signaling domain-containing protein [Candidatus Ranarchaeia archaeon]